ncbi:uncharacterized protein [Parasteatoda tepidariorum]|uniref:uncharacterized protein n=1 Tax=Parasteatoda tepidariorum TaxID=114398 RepID=UPI001C728E98|nr:uncharacterized protein LOC107448414 [Parasteatoda tepidariorum]XP_042909160.1 uncharacterized protein LOC107448414 [Parasteatoda tepidariorum]
MSDWGAPDVQAWKEEARALQQNMFLRLGDRHWDEWDKTDETVLQRKVGFGLYGQPENLPDGNNLGYNPEQFKNIKRIADTILEYSNSSRIIRFYCIFVFGKIWEKRFNIPVFKVKGKQNQTLFVDSDCRVYESWRNYLDSNRLPKCMYCYPRDGLYLGYNGQVLVDFGTSPECDLKNRIWSFFNGAATVVSFASTTVMVASLLTVPIAAPLLVAVQVTSTGTGVYLAAQNVVNLVDRHNHGQSISLSDSESRMAWLGIVGSALGMAQSSMCTTITRSAAAGNVAAKALCVTYNVVTVGSLTVNGLGTLNGFIVLVDKADKGELTSLDVFQFSASFLFFSNSLLNADTAKGIIKNTQKQVLNQYCDNLTPKQIEELFKLSDQVQGKSQLHKNASKIKAVNHIGDKQAFFESLVTARSDLEGHQVQFSFEELGLINIDNELHIAPNKLVQISDMDRRAILDASHKLKNSAMTDAAYWKSIEKVLQKNRVKMQYQRREAIAQLKRAFQTDNLETVKIGKENIFKNMKPSELDRLANVMTSSGKNYDPKVLEIANEFAKMRHCKTPGDYSNYVEFASKYLNDLKVHKEANYQKAFDEATINGPVNRNVFAKYRIQGKRSEHFRNEVFNEFKTNRENSFKALDEVYTNLKSTVLPVNAKAVPKFASESAAIYHVFKHSEFGDKLLTPEQYFDIASNLVNEPVNQQSATLNQQGNISMVVFTNPINGAKGVVYEKLADGTQSLATLFFDYKV